MTDNEMRDYYVTKKIRYEYILDALDEKIDKEIHGFVNVESSFPGELFERISKRVTQLNETRALIAEEINYCAARVKECDAEAEEKEEQA